MKKINILFLLILSILTLSLTRVDVEALDYDVTEFAGAKYYVENEVERNELAYGILHSLSKSFTSTSLSGYDADGLGGQTDLVVPQQFYPQQVNVLEVPSTTNTKIVNWANLNNHKWTLTTVKGLISNYESKNPGWKVIAAINGDFFDIGGNGNLPYQTNNAVITNGHHYKTTTGNNIGITNDGSINSIIGDKKPTRTDHMILAVYDSNDNIIKQFPIENINTTPNANETSVFYATYDTNKAIVPVAVESAGYFVDNAALALPNNENDFYGFGTITSTTAKTISTGQFAIVSNNEEVNAALDLGVKIRTQWEYKGDFENIDTVAGVGATIMFNGEDRGDAGMPNRAPRTVIGRKADGTIVMMVIDGRQSAKNMYGADGTELAAIMASHGVVDAYNLDGGGSSTLVIRQDGQFKVMNSPSDGRERTDANCLLIVAKDPELTITHDQKIDSLSLNINIDNDNGHDINEFFVEMNNEIKPLVSNEVTFTNLTSNTLYIYRLYYQDDEGNLIRIIQDGNLKSLKIDPEFIGIEIVETVENFKIKILYNDPDQAATFKNASIGINGRTTFLMNGEVTLKKSIIGTEVTALSLEYSYDLNDGNRQYIILSEVDYHLHVALEVYLAYFMNIQNSTIDDIYK